MSAPSPQDHYGSHSDRLNPSDSEAIGMEQYGDKVPWGCWRGLIIVFILSLIAAAVVFLASCGATPRKPTPIPMVEHPELARPDPLPEFITRPDPSVSAEMRADWTARWLEASSINAARTEKLNEQIKERDRLLEEERRKAVQTESELKIAEETAKAVSDRETKIVDGCRMIGLALIPLGFAIVIVSFIPMLSWLGLPRKVGMVIVGCGFASLMMARIISGPLAEWLSAGAAVTGLLYGVGAVGMNLWTNFKSSKQADAQDAHAAEYEAMAQQAASTEKASLFLANAVALRASAAQLRRVGRSDYDATRIDPSSTAVALSTGGG